MRIYETLSRQIKELEPLEAGRVGMYTCGPTVYRYSHIGNLRTYVTADLLRRVLAYEGVEVRQVLNITDVGHMTEETTDTGEDKMELAAEDEGLAPEEIADKYTRAFRDHAAALNVLSAALYPKATDHIPQMFEIISKLISKGHAYVVGGTVYFDVDSFPGYGKLSRNTLDRLEAGHRLEETDPRKRRHYDFTLWREAGPRRRLKWESPWGEGYPGWHIECSAMSIAYLGETFDLHTGGSDNIFPHHEDEIAQSEGAVGHPVVRHWNHGHHLLAEGRKMAKSADNYYTVDDLIGHGYDPLAFRLLVMQARYRAQSNFTWEALDAAQRGLERLRRQTAEWASEVPETPSDAGKRLDQEFAEAVADDLDLPIALRVVSKLPSAKVAPGEKSALLRRWDEVLGLDLHREVVSRSELPEGAAEKIAARERARADGDFEAADRLRDELAESGVELIDTPSGTRWVPRRGGGLRLS